MTRLISTVLSVVLFFTLSLPARAQLNMPEASPEGFIRQKVGFTDVSVSYSRPAAKGRKIFGGLVPYGKLWRTGASDATVIRFSDPVTIANKKIKAGAYSLYTIPGEADWTVILNSDTTLHGSTGYEEKLDVLRFKVKPESSARFYESFTISIDEVVNNAAFVTLAWENTLTRFQVQSNADEQIIAEINNRINVKKEEAPGLLYQSALYYYTTNRDPKQALKWVKQANAKREDFAYLQLQAKLQARLNDYTGAIASAKRSSELAQQNKMNDFVKANNALIEEWSTKQK